MSPGAAGVIGLYRPGTSPLHRSPAGVKLLALAVILAALLAAGTLRAVAVGVLVTLLLLVLGRIPAGTLARQLRPVLWWAVPLFALQWVTAGATRAGVVVGQLVVAVALAAVVTLTTRVSAMLTVFETLARPLRPLGAEPARVGLVLALTIRCVPLVAQVYAQAREAAWARGYERRPAVLVVPAVVRLLKQADTMGEALTARGIDD